MDISLKNYWSLYVNFLNDFERLKYRGFSLSYFCHLPSFVIGNEQIWNTLSDIHFAEKLQKKVHDQKEFQEVFNQFVQSHERKALAQNKHGKVVVHVDKLLRFPTNMLKDYFDRTNTIQVISNEIGKRKGVNIPAQRKKTNKAIALTNNIVIDGEKIKKKHTPLRSMINDIPVYYLSNYKIDIEKAVIQIQNQARVIIQSYKAHHLYTDVHFQTWLLNKIAAVVEQIEMSFLFLQDVPASCIIVSTTHSYKSRILALVAMEKGIPTICMQHGIISSELGYIPKIATIDALYGNFEVDWYKKIGVPAHSLEVIGHPRFDQALTQSTITRNTFNSTLGLDPKKKNVMIVVREKHHMDKWRIVIETISKKLSLNILIKNYPSKQPHPLTEEFSYVHSTQAYPIYDIFPNVDAVVAYSSTVGLEAMLANKPVFILEEGFVGYTEYFTMLGKLAQSDPQKLGEIIVTYFTDPQLKNYAVNKRKKFLQYMYPDSLKSAERLVSLIHRLTR